MKRLFLFLFFINVVHQSIAAFPDKDLVIMTSNATSSASLKNIRRITFYNGAMLVDLKDGSAIEWNTDWIDCVVFGESEAEMGTDVMTVSSCAVFAIDDGVLRVSCEVPVAVRLCSCDGKLVLDDIYSGELSYNMKTLPMGVYVLKLNGCTYKILNR